MNPKKAERRRQKRQSQVAAELDRVVERIRREGDDSPAARALLRIHAARRQPARPAG